MDVLRKVQHFHISPNHRVTSVTTVVSMPGLDTRNSLHCICPCKHRCGRCKGLDKILDVKFFFFVFWWSFSRRLLLGMGTYIHVYTAYYIQLWYIILYLCTCFYKFIVTLADLLCQGWGVASAPEIAPLDYPSKPACSLNHLKTIYNNRHQQQHYDNSETVNVVNVQMTHKLCSVRVVSGVC